MSIKILLALGLTMTCCLFTTMAQTPTGIMPQSRLSDDQLEIALNDKRYLMRQIKCALGQAPCDPVGRRIKSLTPLILRGSCPQCTPEEARQIKKVLAHIQRSYPKEWAQVLKQYAGA